MARLILIPANVKITKLRRFTPKHNEPVCFAHDELDNGGYRDREDWHSYIMNAIDFRNEGFIEQELKR